MSSKTHFPYFQLAFILTLGVALSFSAAPDSSQSAPQHLDQSPDRIWSNAVIQQEVFEESVVGVKPNSFSAFKLDPDALSAVLMKAKPEFSIEAREEPVVITLPLPGGSFGRFQIEESSIMEPDLAKRFPQIKTYKGQGLDDPTANVRFELTPEGLHAMVLSASGSFLVDAVGKREANLYASYFKSDLPANPKPFACLAKPKLRKPPHGARRSRVVNRHHAPLAAGDNSLRIYRIAVAASHRYVAAIHALNLLNGTGSRDLVGEALTAISRTIDRVNLIYETELNVRFVLINDETKIIFATAANDPYNDDDIPDRLLTINKRILDRLIGLPNFDIGHLFIVSPGGVAAEPCACQDLYKAKGLSGLPRPAGNVFDVQYVSHEIGHQLGASHSFNGTTAGCKYRNRATAFEPGSGSTIMGYSSASRICGPETVQSTADPYFHAISLQEINTYITSDLPGEGDTCPRKIATGNNSPPVVNAGRDYNIPKGTPFTLAVAGSSDGDGDPLTFSWEEFDLGSPDPPHPPNDRRIRPIFRSFNWRASTLRTFPALVRILTPTTDYVAEILPQISRTMTFRVTARDGRGRSGFDNMQVTVISRRGSANVGPFVVTQPPGIADWPRGSAQTVGWSVAGTRLLPIDCQLVRISLLINGDGSNPIVLADNVPNNGAATITVPSSVPLMTMARVKVEAINNIFFNLSRANIRITR